MSRKPILLTDTDNMDTEKMTYLPQQVRLFVGSTQESIDVMVNRPILIGRSSEHQAVDVDLTLRGGYILGVSRQHVRLAAVGDSIVATDLRSRNGTKLNGVTMRPMQHYPISSGDVLQLSSLNIRVEYIG